MTVVCEDVRVEVGNRLSFMGVFHAVGVEQLPVSLMKIAVINRLEGQGTAAVDVRILSPDRSQIVVASETAPVDLSAGGLNYNLVFFVNVVLPEAGTYWVQTLLDAQIVSEVPFSVVLLQHDTA